MLRFLVFNFGFGCSGSDSGAEVRGESEEVVVMPFDLDSPFPFPFDIDLVAGSKASSSSSEVNSMTSLDGMAMSEFRPRVTETVRIALAARGLGFLERIFARSAMLDGRSKLN